VEDVLVKVRDFTFLVDFVVMEIDEDKDVPLILRRPFINTAKVVIDVDKRNMKMGTHNDEAFFDVSGTPEECMRVEFNLVVKKKTTKSSVWKLLDISSQSKGNIKNWMTIIF